MDSTLDVEAMRRIEAYLDRSEMESIREIPAQHFIRSNRNRTGIRLIVIHSMDGSELTSSAERVARWFAGKNPRFPSPRASVHYVVDNEDIVRSVKDKDVAWHAPGANRLGIGIALTGKTYRSREDWLDESGIPMLLIAAGLTARLCQRYRIPVVFTDARGLRAQLIGITTHREVSSAFHRSTHADPGADFPIDWFVDQVRYVRMKLR